MKIKSIEVKKLENVENEFRDYSTLDALVITKENDEVIMFYAFGDCCSSSFIEDIDNLEVLQDCTLLDIQRESGEYRNNTPDDEYSCDFSAWTFYKFKTNKGNSTLSFRNDSNGYYNGDLQLSEYGTTLKEWFNGVKS